MIENQRHRKYQRVPLAAAEQYDLADDVTHYDDVTAMMKSPHPRCLGPARDDESQPPRPESFVVMVTVEDSDRRRSGNFEQVSTHLP